MSKFYQISARDPIMNRRVSLYTVVAESKDEAELSARSHLCGRYVEIQACVVEGF